MMLRYWIALAMAASALPLEAHAGEPGVSALYGPTCVVDRVLPVMVTALPVVAGLAISVTVSAPLVVCQPTASGPHRQANHFFAVPSGTSRTATTIPFVASDVVTVNPFAASVATAVCTTADGASGDVSSVGAGAVIGGGVAQPASASGASERSVRWSRMPDDAPARPRSATPLGDAKAGEG